MTNKWQKWHPGLCDSRTPLIPRLDVNNYIWQDSYRVGFSRLGILCRSSLDTQDLLTMNAKYEYIIDQNLKK